MAESFCCPPSSDPLSTLNALKSHRKFPAYFDALDFPRTISNNYPTLCTLTNESLFPLSHLPLFSPSEAAKYTPLEPALLLASQIILSHTDTFRPFIHSPTIEGTQPPLSQSSLLSMVRTWLPNIEFEDVDREGSFWGVTLEKHKTSRDVLCLDYALIRILRSSIFTHERKVAAAVYMAVLICKGLADVLGYRSLRPGQAAEGAMQRRVNYGNKWEDAVFGEVAPVCEQYSLKGMRGLAVNACSKGFAWMRCGEPWMRNSFDDQHWTEENPLRPPKDGKFSRTATFGLDMEEEEEEGARGLEITINLIKMCWEAGMLKADAEGG